MILAERSQIL